MGAQSSNLLWRIPTQTNSGGPAIARDGTIYQGTDFGQLLAINPDGTTKWVVSSAYWVSSTPAILLDGRIVFVDEGGSIWVINPDGSRSWRYRTGTPYLSSESSPAIGWDGTIFTGIDEVLYAFHPDGSIRWTYDFSQTITGTVTVSRDGVVYVPSGWLFAIGSDGSFLWRSADPLGLGGAPAIGTDRTIYVNSPRTTLYAFNPDGTLKWSYKAGDCCDNDPSSSPAIGTDGTIYAGETITPGEGLEGVILALNPDGSLKWEAHYGASPTALSLGGDGTIYFGGTGPSPAPPSVYALNPDGTLMWQYDDVGYIRTPPAIGLGRRVYAGGSDAFFAIGS